MNRRTLLKTLAALPLLGFLAPKAEAKTPKPGTRRLCEILWSPHEPSGTMIAVEVPVDHPPVALCRVMSPDGTAFVGYNVTTGGDTFHYPVGDTGLHYFDYDGKCFMRATANTGLSIVTGLTSKLQPVTCQHAAEQIDNHVLFVCETTTSQPYTPPVYVFVSYKTETQDGHVEVLPGPNDTAILVASPPGRPKAELYGGYSIDLRTKMSPERLARFKCPDNVFGFLIVTPTPPGKLHDSSVIITPELYQQDGQHYTTYLGDYYVACGTSRFIESCRQHIKSLHQNTKS